MRLLFISNRLPITVVDESTLKLQESVGGLASGLRAYLDSVKSSSAYDYAWIGWPGMAVRGKKKELLSQKLASEFNAYPVFLSEKSMDRFYHGFCNRTIWPLFHYFPVLTMYDEEHWDNYKQVNQNFCDEILKILRPDDVVWIHDYHLMLLPKLLREKAPETTIGFFLHIPFPTYEVFRLLPSAWRSEILEGLLGADLVGFHTHDYTSYFLRCVLRILGHEPRMGKVVAGGRMTKADTFPMGIDFDKFESAAKSQEVSREVKAIKKNLQGSKVVLSLDRLDYTKGIINRLKGYESFLRRNPEWQGNVTLIAAVVPSRVKVDHYQQMKRQIDELVGKINGSFGKINWTPILYSYRFLPFEQLVALYCAADVALVTPLRDGMNLIAKEYLASKTDGKGVLILSEMAGASKFLDEAVIINPSNVGEIADALKTALEMPEDEQIRRNEVLRSRIKSCDVVCWADSFISSLLSTKEEQERLMAVALDRSVCDDILGSYLGAERRLLLLDYDGTLVPFSNDPKSAVPGEALLKTLKLLSEDPKNEVVLISGRDRAVLDEWFKGLDIGLVAEHGAWIKRGKGDWSMLKSLSSDWKPMVLPIIKRYADRLPGALVEEKEYSLVWHYRAADPEAAQAKARELVDDLLSFTSNIPVQVLQGNKIVEVRCSGINKGMALISWISEGRFDFIMAAGDDSTDEDMFKALPGGAYSVKVGPSESRARFRLNEQSYLIELIERMAREGSAKGAQ
jgi:trehalose 6-phosphate synthase/phosphatase